MEDFVLPARVVRIKHRDSINPSELDLCEIASGGALLFKTDNSASGRCYNGMFSEKYVYLSPEGAQVCVDKKVGLVGLDYITIERYTDNAFTSHHRLLGSGIPILESINLKEVPDGRFTLVCLPSKMKGCEVSPVRAILLC